MTFGHLVVAGILQLSILDVGTPLLLLNSFVIVLQVDVTVLMPVGSVKNCTNVNEFLFYFKVFVRWLWRRALCVFVASAALGSSIVPHESADTRRYMTLRTESRNLR